MFANTMKILNISPVPHRINLVINNLSPIVHPYKWDLYRVPLRKEKDHYTMYVADGYTRKFDEKTLPDEVKSKMAMILASDHELVRDDEISHLNLMLMRNNELANVGWQASDSWFVVVLPYSLLMKLRGEDNGNT